MTEFAIQSSDGTEIRHAGELVHKDSFEVVPNDQITRNFVLDVYAVEGGGFVTSIEFQTSCSREESVKFCEEADNLDEVEKFFYVFDLGEHLLPGDNLAQPQKLEHSNILKWLAKEYESRMHAFLEVVNKRIAELGYTDRISDQKPGSIWGIFKSK
ncbi:MAG: hypothetical protein AB8B55_14355 [Mariniblastus sp.]